METESSLNTKSISDFLRIIPLISIGFGFIFTSFYFMDIGYFPQNDINSFISIFFYIFTLCLLVIGIIPFLSIFSVTLWVRNTFSNLNISRQLINQEEIETACNISIYDLKDKTGFSEKITHKMQVYYAVSMIVGMIILLILQKTRGFIIVTSIAAIIATISFLSAPAFVWNSKKRNADTAKNHISAALNAKKRKFDYALFLLLYTGNTLASSLILYLLISLALLFSPSRDLLDILIIGMMTVAFSACWLSYMTEHQNKIKAYLFFFIAYSMTILFITHDKLITSTMKESKLGSFNASIFVDYDTCTMFKNLGKKTSCEKNEFTQIDDVTIKWKGADEYITFKTDSNANYYIIVPSSSIKGMGGADSSPPKPSKTASA